MGTSNGEHGVKHVPVSVITLTFTALPWHLDIKATVENYDQALAMLDQARRWFEAELRAQGALALQQRMQQAARDQAIADAVRGKG